MSKSQSQSITILTACSGLGSFVPAVSLSHFLQRNGHSVEFKSIEQLFHDEGHARFQRTQKLCERDMRSALIAQQLIDRGAANIRSSINDLNWTKLKREWQQNTPDKFILFSGFWLPLIAEFYNAFSGALSIDAIHMDAVKSSSWTGDDEHKWLHHHWLYEDGGINRFQLLVPSIEVPTWSAREARVACHGGGWDIGDTNDAIKIMLDNNRPILSSRTPTTSTNHGHKLEDFLITSDDWKPSTLGSLEGGKFPPQIRYSGADGAKCRQKSNFQQHLAHCRGLVTKPGGASLLDSLTTITPLILLPSYGQYEKKNGELWLRMGFAVSFDEWQREGFSWQVLQKLHNNLKVYTQTLENYGERYATKDLAKIERG